MAQKNKTMKPLKVKKEKIVKEKKEKVEKVKKAQKQKVEKVKEKVKQDKAKFGIAAQILICFIIPVMFVIIVGVQAYQTAADGLNRKFMDSTNETLQMTVEYVELGCEFIAVEALQYAFNDNLGKYYLGLYKDEPIEQMSALNEANDMISTTKMSNSFVNDIHIITKSGMYFLTTSTGTSSVNRDGFYNELRDAFKEEYPTGRVPNWIDTHPLIDERLKLKPEETIMSYVIQSNGNNAYVIVDMKNKKIQQVLNGIDFGEGSIVGLVTTSGKESLSGTEEKSFFADKDFYLDAVASEETEGQANVVVDGTKYIFLYSGSAKGTFNICALVPESIVIAQAIEIKNVTIIMVIIASIVAVLVGIFLSMKMGKSMKRMMKSMSEVAEGDLTIRVKDKGVDEFSLLAGSMNNMVSNTKGLVLKVANSTVKMEESTHAVTAASEVINDYSENITSAIGEIHEGMNIQAQNAQECLQKTDMLSEEIQLISQRVEDIEKLVNQTGDQINEGIKTMAILGTRANETTDMTEKVSESINVLQKEFEQIKGFVDTINSISEETNLLSLNASIEAARAGDAGRGFSVVADQIRKLADGSAQAAAEIQKTVEGIRTQTSTSVENANQAKAIVELQTQAVEEVKSSFQGMQRDMMQVVGQMKEIANNTEKADAGRAATLQAIENISAVIEETAAAAAVVNDTAEKLLSHVGELKDTADVLDENMKGLKAGIEVFKTE